MDILAEWADAMGIDLEDATEILERAGSEDIFDLI